MRDLTLDVKDLHVSFFTRRGEVKAVDGVSFHVRQAETLGIVGESGCGKTVTGLALMRLLPEPAGRITSGSVVLEGIDLVKLSKKEMRSIRGKLISMILQDPMTSLNPVFPVGDQIAESIRLHRGFREDQVQQEVISTLKLLRIPAPESRVHDYPFQLSGGMRQRVVGAVAMSCRPRLLIADEPTTALDATIQAQYIDLFKDIQRETDVAIVFITHDFGVIADMCHRVAVMYAGKIVETAATTELFKAPRHPYTVALMESVPRLDRKSERLYSIQGQPPSLMNLPPGCRFYPRCADPMDICRERQPEEAEVGNDHLVSCWRVK